MGVEMGSNEQSCSIDRAGEKKGQQNEVNKKNPAVSTIESTVKHNTIVNIRGEGCHLVVCNAKLYKDGVLTKDLLVENCTP